MSIFGRKKIITKEDYINGIIHPRRKQLAKMIFGKATEKEFKEAGFTCTSVREKRQELAILFGDKVHPCNLKKEGESVKGVQKKLKKKGSVKGNKN